jgi:hypothetical protein
VKTLNLMAAALAMAALVAAPAPALAGKSRPAPASLLATTAVTPLTDAEIATLKWMREEEKLARDVYIELNAYWPAQIFVNIAESEQRHFDALGAKLDLYGIDDPALPGIGVFFDPALQALHDELLALGMTSRVAALEVGVTIEETDMVDLRVAIDGTTSVPLQVTYGHLLDGSEHHLEAFIEELEAAGIDYEH